MRVFQNAGLYKSYLPRLRELGETSTTYSALLGVFLADRFGAAHTLLPILRGEESACFTNGDDEKLQHLWAREQGMSEGSSLSDILRAQIEHHRTEVFYNMDPMRYGAEFIAKLPGCVKLAIAWRAAPSPRTNFTAYDCVVCNFPGILADFARQGCKTAYFAPAHDPVMDEYASNSHRPIDVLFVGSYSRHHRQRARLLESVASLDGGRSVVFHLDESRATRLAESVVCRVMPLRRFRRSHAVRALSRPPIFGRELYGTLAQSKIVLNSAIDMAGFDRGNMRCWEALGCGALMVSDAGNYPVGMIDGQTIRTFSNTAEAIKVIEHALVETDETEAIAAAGKRMISAIYSKQSQWADFQKMCGNQL